MKLKKTLIILIPVILISGIIYFSAQYLITRDVVKKIDNIVQKTEDFMKIEYDSVRFVLITRDIVIKNVVITNDEQSRLTIKKILINKIDLESEIPAYIDIKFSDIDLSAGGKSILNSFTESIGYKEEIDFDISLKYQYKSETGDFNLERFKFSSPDAGSLTFSLNLGNLKLDEALPENIMSGLNPVLLKSARLDFNDASITDRSLKFIAESIEMNLKDFKSLLNMQLDFLVNNVNSDLSSQSVEKLKEYIRQPGSVTFLMNPAEPVPVDTLIVNYNKPIKLINILDIDIQ